MSSYSSEKAIQPKGIMWKGPLNQLARTKGWGVSFPIIYRWYADTEMLSKHCWLDLECLMMKHCWLFLGLSTRRCFSRSWLHTHCGTDRRTSLAILPTGKHHMLIVDFLSFSLACYLFHCLDKLENWQYCKILQWNISHLLLFSSSMCSVRAFVYLVDIFIQSNL